MDGGNPSGAMVDKYTRFGLTQVSANLIAAPLIRRNIQVDIDDAVI